MQMKANKNGVKLLAAVMVFAMAFAGVSVIMSDDSDAATTYVSGGFTDDMTFTSGSTVVVNGDLTIDKGYVITVEDGATFTINSGVKVTVDGLKDADDKESKAKFIVGNGARLIINGDLVVGQYGTADICTQSIVSDTTVAQADEEKKFYNGAFVYGNVKVQKGGILNIAAEVMDGGSVSSTSSGNYVSTIGGTLDIMSGANVSVKSNVSVTGLVVKATGKDLSKASPEKTDFFTSSVKIDEVNVKKTADVSSFEIRADSSTMTAYTVVEKETQKNTIIVSDIYVDADVKNTTITLEKCEGDDKSYFKTNNLGNKGDSAIDIQANIIVDTDSKIDVAKEAKLDLKAGSSLVVKGSVNVKGPESGDSNAILNGSMVVEGTVLIDNSKIKTVVLGGSVEITGGNITIKTSNGENDGVTIEADLYGAVYTTEADSVLSTIFCDLADAIKVVDGDKITEVTVYGWNSSTSDSEYKGAYVVTEDFTVAENVSFNVINVLKVPADRIVTFDAEITEINTDKGMIVVDGKIIDNSSYDGGKILSEVVLKNEETSVQIFTSLKLAIADASAGDKIELSGETVVKGTMTIPEGVTVDIKDNKFTVDTDSTLIVDGVIIDSNKKIYTAEKDGTKSAGKIVVNNYIITDLKYIMTEDGKIPAGEDRLFNAPGVYGGLKVDGKTAVVVMSPAVYIANSKDIVSATICGPVTIKDDFTLAGEDGNTLTVDGDLTVGTMTIDGFTVSVTQNGTFNGKIANTVGTVVLSKVNGTLTVSDYYDDVEDKYNLVVEGEPTSKKEKDKYTGTIAIESGALVTNGINTNGIKSFTISEGTTLTVNGVMKASDLTVDGTMDIAEAGKVNATGDITIVGTVNIDEAAVDAIIADNIYSKDVDGNAVLNGTQVSCGLIYAAAGSVIDEDLVTDKAAIEFYVEDALWITVYQIDVNVLDVEVSKAPVTDGIFDYWADDKGKTIESDVDTVSFTNGDVVKAYAKADYYIYDVSIVADNGIGTVALDGIVLAKISNTFYAYDLKAGTHTITYELKNGYEGTVKMTVNGQAVSGLSFTLSGTDDLTAEITLSGTAPAEPTTPVTPTPTPSEKDDGMGITDYLLIVLVIMVVILAIVVIARMFRS